MKTHVFLSNPAATLTLIAGLAAAPAITRAQTAHYVTAQPAPVTFQLATSDMSAFGLSQIAGQPLRGKNGEELGQITDFLADPQTGIVHFALVPSGGGPAGDTYRVVPLGALDVSNSEVFVARVGQGQWDRAGTIVERRLQGRIVLDSDFRARLGEQFSLNGEPAEGVTEFVRVSQLRGQPVRSGNQQLGTIEDVLVDVRHRTAAVVLAPTVALGGTPQRYLVPFQQLQLLPDASGAFTAITTSLTPAQFQQLQPSLAPTGYTGYGAGGTPFSTGATSQPFTPANAGPPPAGAAAAAVQQAIAGQQAGAGIQVIPESRIVLRGTVQTQQQKLEIERAAVQAARGVAIENQISVRNW